MTWSLRLRAASAKDKPPGGPSAGDTDWNEWHLASMIHGSDYDDGGEPVTFCSNEAITISW